MDWKIHVNKIIPTFRSACYVIRSVYLLFDVSTFKTIYYAFFHSVMEYGIIFWGNSSFTKKVLQIQHPLQTK